MLKKLQVRERERLGDRNILGVALDVHTTNTGGMERSFEDQRNDRRLLIDVLRIWEPSLDQRSTLFDEAVHHLVRAALLETGWINQVSLPTL